MTVKDIAHKLGYDGVQKEKIKYNGYDVYTCTMDDKMAKVGTPTYILVKGNKYKISEEDWGEIYDEIAKAKSN